MGAALAGGATARRGLASWARRRAVPLSVSVAFVVVGMQASLWWYGLFDRMPGVWRMPGDFWTTYLSSVELVHGHLSAIYSPATGLVALPGVSFVLAPVAAITSALGWPLGPPAEGFWTPASWLVAGPVMLGLSCAAIFGADRLAERWGLLPGRRLGLALAEAVALLDVSLIWGHPEDALAVGLVLYAVAAATEENWRRAATLLGFAIAFQPLAVLAVPAVLAPHGLKGATRLLWRLALPAAAVISLPLVAEPHAVLHALLWQPNYPSFNHPTPWTALAPKVANGGVGAGPTRALATVLALAGGAWFCRRRPAAEKVVLVIGGAFAVRVLFEAVMADYYVWPVLAVFLLLAARRGPARLWATSVAAAGEVWLAQQHFGGVWPWWLATIALLAVVGLLAAPLGPAPAGTEANLLLSAAGSSAPLS